MSGLPRSGSTVLAAILNQNPEVYVTPTSPMLSVTAAFQTVWREDPAVKANYCDEQGKNLTKALLGAYWEHRNEKIIIDKARGWAKNMPNASNLFGYPIKAISVERDLPSIMASWLTILKKNPNNSAEQNVRARGYLPTDENLMKEMWFFMVKDCMDGLYQMKREVPSQFISIHYDDLIEKPQEQLTKISEFLDLPNYKYAFDCIENDTVDDDLVAWGLDGLHTIRSKLEKTSQSPKEVLGDELYDRFVEIESSYKV